MRDEPVKCWRCGIPIDVDLFWKRVKRCMANPDECRDCRDTSVRQKSRYDWVHPVLGAIRCKPFKGELDDDWNPVNKRGELYMPGERVCGLKDCVAESHVKKRVMLIADPVESLLAVVEAQNYVRKTPPTVNVEGATE